ncbi:FabG Dehydrogenases with different specificities (related to short-chain alcohol dehydrogenases) [Acidimicrobiia bacterium]
MSTLPTPAIDPGIAGRRIRILGSGPLARTFAEDLADCGAEIVDSSSGSPVSDLDALVFAPWDAAVMKPVAMAELRDDEFDEAWQQTMDSAVAACTQARLSFRNGRGCIVLTFPTTAFTGGAGYSHWAAAAEGVHILAKSAARQWGPEGIAVNSLAISPALVLADPVAAGPVSIATPARPEASAGPVLAFLCSEAAHNLAGQALTVDGGSWM